MLASARRGKETSAKQRPSSRLDEKGRLVDGHCIQRWTSKQPRGFFTGMTAPCRVALDASFYKRGGTSQLEDDTVTGKRQYRGDSSYVCGNDIQRKKLDCKHVCMVTLLNTYCTLISVHTHSGTLLGVPTASNRRWKLIFLRRKGTISALEALRDAIYKSTTTTTTITKTACKTLNADKIICKAKRGELGGGQKLIMTEYRQTGGDKMVGMGWHGYKCFIISSCTRSGLLANPAVYELLTQSVRENVFSNSKKRKNVRNFYMPLNHSSFRTQLPKVGTGKSPTSNNRSADTRNYSMQLRTVCDKRL